MVRIGIPRTLWYYSYYPFWQKFFTGIGVQVVLSPPTTRATMDAGVAACVSEACLPVKVYFGHLQELARRKVDYIFAPRLVCLNEKRVFCPKFLGLPDLVRRSGLTLPPLLEVRLDRRDGPHFLLAACLRLGKRLGIKPMTTVQAFISALRVQHAYVGRLQRGEPPVGVNLKERLGGTLPDEDDAAPGVPATPAAAQGTPGAPAEHLPPPAAARGRTLEVALLGYPYLIFDEHLNLGLLKKLRSMGVAFRSAETLPEKALQAQNGRFPKRLFWHYSDIAVRSGYHFLAPEHPEVDGVIHVTAFACGPDAVVDKMLELEAERHRRPYLNITLDEQSGEAGYVTRLEAFVDMLRRKEALSRG